MAHRTVPSSAVLAEVLSHPVVEGDECIQSSIGPVCPWCLSRPRSRVVLKWFSTCGNCGQEFWCEKIKGRPNLFITSKDTRPVDLADDQGELTVEE